jgi:hypothetical protein
MLPQVTGEAGATGEIVDIYSGVLYRMRMTEDNNNNSNKLSADLVSSTCQFCGKSFSRGTDLSLHYKEEHIEEIGKEA